MVESRRYGSVNSRPHILPQERAVNIDSEIDFLLAEVMISNNPRTYIQQIKD